MCYNKACSSFHQVIHGFLNALFGTSIYRRCCFIQNQYGIVGKNGSCNCKQLFLSLRYIGRIFIKLHFISFRQCSYKMICMSSLGCCNNFFISGIKSSIADILHNCPFKQPCILQYHTEIVSEIMTVEIADIMTVKRNTSAIHIIKSHKKLYYCCFSCTCRTDNCYLLSRFYISTEIFYNYLLWIISESHMAEGYSSLRVGKSYWIFSRLVFLLFSEEFKNSFRCSCHGLNLIYDLSNLLNRLREIFYILDERLNVTYPDSSPYGQYSSADSHACITHVSHKHHNRLHQSRKKLGFPR